MFPQKLVTRLRDRLVQSRFLTISLTLHVILVLVLGMIVVVKPMTDKGDMTAAGPLVEPVAEMARPPENPSIPVQPKSFTPSTPSGATGNITEILRPIRSDSIAGAFVPIPSHPGMGEVSKMDLAVPPPSPASGLTRQQLADIGIFTKWRTNDPSSSKPSFEFTAFVGKYGGNWNSTVRVSKGEITGGSLPNLLYVTSKWTKDRIKTNEREVKAIPLDSGELFTARPPFIFLTGTRDFKLTDAEVENLRNYIRLGGAVWGDSSAPGQRSAFDIAFRREMERVVGGGVENKFERLPENHPAFAGGYFPQVRALPEGINHYREPVQVLRWNGEIAVIHTTNDYGDMWQVGLDKNGQIDLSRNEHGEFVALNQSLWEHRGTYVRNIEQPAVEQSYKFGINLIVHLLTRWESRTANSAPL